jgi:toxin ParE1/3/4
MNVEYSRRALADLRNISAYHLHSNGDRVASEIEARIRDVVARIARSPGSAPPVVGRQGVRVVLLLRYPYKIFYKPIGGTIRIVHIRHTARRPWARGR